MGAGSAFNVDEKDFVSALYAVIQRLFEMPLPLAVEEKDFVALLTSIDLVFQKRKQLSIEMTNAFVKRLALVQMHLIPSQQAAMLLVIKTILNKYPSARSAMLDIDDDTVTGGFAMTPTTALYRGEIDDPYLANASETHIIFELCHTCNWWTNHLVAAKRNSV